MITNSKSAFREFVGDADRVSEFVMPPLRERSATRQAVPPARLSC
jgi:hypothetical protein